MRVTTKRLLTLLWSMALLAGCGGDGSSTPVSGNQAKLLATSSAVPANYASVVQQLYVSYFGRPADAAGLTFYEGILAGAGAPTTLPEFNAAYSSNASVKTIIDGFGISAESTALYGTDTNVLVNAVYRNLFNRDAEPAGLAFWAGLINGGTYTKGQAALIIMSFAQSTDLTAVNNKVTVAKNFTDALATPAQSNAYSGLTPNVTVRTMLGTVSDTTDTSAFQSTVISTIGVIVANSHSVGGTISGLTADGLVLSNGGNTFTLARNATSFTLPTQLSSGDSYSVSIASQPPGFTDVCTLGNASGTVGNANISAISVSCHTALAVVTTFAGSVTQGNANGTGVAARFNNPQGVAVDSSGNVYVADTFNRSIRKITPSGVVTTFAGSGISGSTNGTGTAASFRSPGCVAVDSSDNVYVADYSNHLIRKITPAGVVTTLAGSGLVGSVNGAGPVASFNQPSALAVDSAGNVYVADFGNNLIRKITSSGTVTTFAGSGTAGSANGTGPAASFYGPSGIAVDSSGNVYVADTINNSIRKITSSGVVTTLAGSVTSGSTNGTGTSARFYDPNGVAVDTSGNLYVADSFNNLIRKITPAGVVTTLAGSGVYGSADGTGIAASFSTAAGLAVDTAGKVYVADTYNNLIRKISPE